MELKTYFAQDKDGATIPGAYVYLYRKGTTTLVSGVTDAEGNSLPNPFQANEDGQVQLAAPNGVYDLRMTGAGRDNTIRVQFLDAVEAIAGIDTSADRAEAGADRAEAARDAAQLSAGIYSDTSSGLTDTAEGNYFSVPSPANDEFLILYRHDAGPIATEIARYPTTIGLDALRTYADEKTDGLTHPQELADSEIIPLVADKDGLVPLGIDKNGALHAFKMALSLLGIGNVELSEAVDDFSTLLFAFSGSDEKLALSVDKFGRINGGGFSAYKAFDLFPGADYEIPFSVLDANDRLVLGVDNSGRLILPNLPAQNVAVDPTNRNDVKGETWGVDINHFLMNGQSLSVRGSDVVTLQDGSDLVFSGGLKLDVDEINNNFTTMAYDNTSGVLFNAMQQLKFLMAGDGATYKADPLYSDDYTLLASSHGSSGASIEELVKGGTTTSYEGALHAVQEAVRLAAESGQSYAVQALNWIQGESNRYDTSAEYIASFNAMLTDYRNDISLETGQPHGFKVFTYQPSGQQYDRTVGQQIPNTIAQAFFELSEADSDILIVTPTYWIEHSDALHPTWEGGQQFGLMWGKVLYKVLYRAENWRPLEPARVDAYGNRVIVVRFNVPEPPLVLDTTNVTNPGNYGFDVRDDSGLLGITGVEIVGTNAVRITVDRDLSTNPMLSYAYYGIGGNGGGPIEGARGNLRDSDPTIGVNGFNKLWNWCVAFNTAVPYVKS